MSQRRENEEKAKKASEKLMFNLAGPTHLTSVDWSNQHHRRTVAASLVQSVYILEHDRQQNQHNTPQALAPKWWTFFHFHLVKTLIDHDDSSIFGAIFKFKPQNQNSTTAPKYIIAFRGTLLKQNCIAQDLKLDYQIFSNKLHKRPRFLLAMISVQSIAATAGNGNLWLAGHSLGSAIAMLAGKNMATTGSYIETYLFNPPFITAPLEKISHSKVRHGMRITGSVIKAGLTVAMKGTHNDIAFIALSEWKPYLFINAEDRICSEYIGYFEHRKMMMGIGAEKIQRLATQNSAKSLLFGAMGKETCETLHLLPSAHLTINKCLTHDFLKAHEVNQWWRPDIHCQTELHQFKRKTNAPLLIT